MIGSPLPGKRAPILRGFFGAAVAGWIVLGVGNLVGGEGVSGAGAEAGAKALDHLDHWSFQAPRRSEVGSLEDASWVRRGIDPFILREIEREGLDPAPEAGRQALIRRASFDAIGLPPRPEQVEAFVTAPSGAAYEALIDELLGSPHFGERWARLWLDVMRYGEDQAHIVGNNKSLFYPNAYRYRDWVVEAFNRDLPFDDFVRLQLAADLMHPEDRREWVALGFVGLGPKYYRRNSPKVMADEWEDRIDTVTRGLMGVTVACARCHDHKYDPIPTSDYYALAGVFASTEMYNLPLSDETELDKNGRVVNPDEALHIIRDQGEPQHLNVHIRGDVEQQGPEVRRGFLSALCGGEPETFTEANSGRLDLAEAIVDRDNPLTARVLVNRVWAQLFGQALVGTPSNFGLMGEEPSHPELLDDLAVRFMEEGWSFKWLVRELMLSATYRQSTDARPDVVEKDPGNGLYTRMPRRRLQVEQWRDALLAGSGTLDRQIGGPSIDPGDPDVARRTLYSEASRLKLNEVLARFDYPDPNQHSPKRDETTTPLQKLFVLNHPLMVSQASALARRLQTVAEGDRERIVKAYTLLYARPPTDAEVALGLRFLEEVAKAEDQGAAWEQYAHVLLAANEFYYLD